MSGIRHQEFLRELENTNYPFTPTSSLSNGQVTLANSVFLDCALYPASTTGRLYLAEIEVTTDRLTITVGDSSNAALLTGTVTLPVSQSSVALEDNLQRSAGLLMSEVSRLGLLTALGLGRHVFTREQAEFCVVCYTPQPSTGVTGFRLPDGSVVSGEVWLLGAEGVVLRQSNAGGVTTVRVDVVGDPLYLQRQCGDTTLYQPVNPVRRIRVLSDAEDFECSPDTRGNFSIQINNNLAPNTSLRTHTTDLGLVIEVLGSPL